MEQHAAAVGDIRPRERLSRSGVENLRDCELIALILGAGVAGNPVETIAGKIQRYLDRSNGDVRADQLAEIPGVGPVKAATFVAAFELARRIHCPRRTHIRLPSDVLAVLDRFADRKQECFFTISLNGAHEVLATRMVTVGLVNKTMVHPREIFADPLADRAAAIILAHNHPSGCVAPSEEDHEVTRRAVNAGLTIGIPVLDHIVFSIRGYYSFLEHDEI